MTTIPLEQMDQRIVETLKQQRLEDPILLTNGSDLSWLLLRLPEGTQDSGVDAVLWLERAIGRLRVFSEAKYGPQGDQDASPGGPVLGSCRGMLTILSEDDEHLKDFAEYLE